VPRESLIDFFNDLDTIRGEFLVHDDGFRSRHYTYEQVSRAARVFAQRLREAGVSRGDKIVMWSENRPEWIAAFWGCLLAGNIVVPVDYRASADFPSRVAQIVDARFVLTGEDVSSSHLGTHCRVWPLQDAIDWTAPAKSVSPAAAARDDIAEIIFTSGATAEPKGVLITHRNILANIVPVEKGVMEYRKWARPFSPIRFLNLLPLSHMFGQAMATFVPPMLKGTVVFIRGFNPADIMNQIKSRRVSVLVSVPKILDVLREYVIRVAPEAAQPAPGLHVARRWWKYRRIHHMFGLKFWSFVVGAAPLDAELEAFWQQLGFVVVQGYGLTETAPIVTLNHPFSTQKGSVGKTISGVEIKIASDGEILVRGENVTSGYFNAAEETARAFEDGWFHTGDIGELRADGQLFIRGRKKEMIVTPEGLNVFPEDVERVLNELPGVHESAVVGLTSGAEERVHAVLVTDPGVDPDSVVRAANLRLADHQKIRRAALWPESTLPRTEGTAKLKRAAIRDWLRTGVRAPEAEPGADRLTELLRQQTGRTDLAPDTTLDELGLSSLERVELMVALEDAFHAQVDEAAFSGARDIGHLRTLIEQAAAGRLPAAEPIAFPVWNRRWVARAVRRVNLPTWILPLTRLFAWVHVEGLEHLAPLQGPVFFAPNHQSHMDLPVILAALPSRWRYRVASAMAKEFFKAHFFPESHTRVEWFTNSLNYYLAALLFNTFPLPKQEAGARQTLHYISTLVEAGYSVLIFPEGEISEDGEIHKFRPGIGMLASRLELPVVPVRLDGLDRVLHTGWHMARPGRVRVAFGPAMRLPGDDYEALSARVEDAVRAL
jgi:long-chain acyl-CoA synthetase